MSEETDAPQGGAEGAVAPEAVDENAEATTAQPTGTETPELADETGEPPAEPVKKVPWWEKRFGELTADKYEAQRQADYWRGLAEGRSKPEASPAPQSGPPQLEQFDDYDAYETARIEYAVEQRLEKSKQQEKERAALTTYQEREAALRTSKPDFDTIALNPRLPVTVTMAQAIHESDLGPEVLYHLGSNPQEAARISALSVARQAAEIGRIEAALTKPPTANAVTQKPIPPAPPATVNALSAGMTKPLEELSMAEYVAARKREQT
jgi:hypothetical protein